MDYSGRIFRDEGARLRHLASFPEGNPNPIFEVGADGSLVYANPATLRLFPDLYTEGWRHPLLAGLDRHAVGTDPAGYHTFEAEAGVRSIVWRSPRFARAEACASTPRTSQIRK